MRSIALMEILEGVDRLEADAQAKQQFRRLVLAIGASHGVRGMDHVDRVNFACRLLTLKTSRATIRDRLRAIYGVSRRQAYRIIEDAMQLCREHALNGTRIESN